MIRRPSPAPKPPPPMLPFPLRRRPAARRRFSGSLSAAVVRVEALEERRLLTATVTNADGVLYVTADADDDRIVVRQTGEHRFAVAAAVGQDDEPVTLGEFGGVTEFVVVLSGGGNDDVTVSGAGGVPSVSQGVYVGTGDGADVVRFLGIETDGYLAAITGAGIDTVYAGPGDGGAGGSRADIFYAFTEGATDFVVAEELRTDRDFVAVLGDGDDELSTRNLDVGDTSFVFGQAGDDRVLSEGDRYGTNAGGGDGTDRFAYVVLGEGDDTATVSGATVNDMAVLFGEAGADLVTVENSTLAGNAFALLGDGDDRIVVDGEQTGNAFLAAVVLDGGAGTDTVDAGGPFDLNGPLPPGVSLTAFENTTPSIVGAAWTEFFDFEGPFAPDSVPGVGPIRFNQGGVLDVGSDPDRAFSGDQFLRWTFTKDEQIAFATALSPVGVRTLSVKVMMQFPQSPGPSDFPASLKLLRVASNTASGGTNTQWIVELRAEGDDDPLNQPMTLSFNANSPNAEGRIDLDFTPEPGRWYEIEVRSRINTPGLRDGVAELLIDGERRVVSQTAQYRKAGEDFLFDRVDIASWHSNGSRGDDADPAVPLVVLMDDVTIVGN